MSTFRLDQAIEILERTPSVLSTQLDGLSATWIHANEGPHTWSAYDIVGHLVHGERTDWIERTQIIIEYGTGKPFEPFDRFAQMETDSPSLDSLLDEFEKLRKENLGSLKGVTDADLDKQGVHPDFGRVTLRQLLSAWVVHDLGHVAQIARVMAKRYAHDVGPWIEYLPILTDRT